MSARNSTKIAIATALALTAAMVAKPDQQAQQQPPRYSTQNFAFHTDNVAEMVKNGFNTVQLGQLLRGDTKRIEVNVVASPKSGATLINGLGNNGIWYQYGVITKQGGTFGTVFQLWTNRTELTPGLEFVSTSQTPITQYGVLKLSMSIADGYVVMTTLPLGHLKDMGAYFALKTNSPADRAKGTIIFQIPTDATKFLGVDNYMDFKGTNYTLKGKSNYCNNSSIFTEFFTPKVAGEFNWQAYQVKFPPFGATNIFFAGETTGTNMMKFSAVHGGKTALLEKTDKMMPGGEVDGIQLCIISTNQFLVVGPNPDKPVILPDDLDGN